jgi:hypothetical protein
MIDDAWKFHDDEYRRVWWQSATLLATNLIYTPKKIEQNGKKQHKKTAIALVDLGRKTEFTLVALVGRRQKKN